MRIHMLHLSDCSTCISTLGKVCDSTVVNSLHAHIVGKSMVAVNLCLV